MASSIDICKTSPLTSLPILAFKIEVGILPGLNPGILAVNAISDNFSLILSSISFAEINILNSRLSPF